ncbi:MAG TPA: DUF302 domain-containing protein [Holophagaceae bacterium]|nr:DUF302 domain-containing protein [Holophagaceae bacterium]
MPYTLDRTFPGGDHADVLTRTRAALQAEGFGIPVEMDTRAIFQAKLGKESDPRVILGACLPAVAFEALAVEPQLAAFLPCNVTVHATAGGVTVSAVDPEVLFALTSKVDPAHATQVKARLQSALDRI